MLNEKIKEVLTEGVALTEENINTLAGLVDNALLEQKVKIAEQNEAKIAELTEANAKAVEDAVAVANARLDEAVDLAVDQFITENESRFVATETFGKMEAVFAAVRSAFEANGFALNENAAVEGMQAKLDESKTEYDTLFERYTALRDEHTELQSELETAKRAIIFESQTGALSETQKERVGKLVEAVEFDSTEEFSAGLKLIVEMETKKDEEGKEAKKDDDTDGAADKEGKDGKESKEGKDLKEQRQAPEVVKPLHEMTHAERVAFYTKK